MPTCEHVHATIRALAAALDLDEGTLRRWIEDGMPGKSGHWDEAQALRWRRKRDMELGLHAAGGDGAEPKKPRERKEYWMAVRQRLAARKEAVELMEVARHRDELLALTRAFVALLERLPRELDALLGGSGAYEEPIRSRLAAGRSALVAAQAAAGKATAETVR